MPNPLLHSKILQELHEIAQNLCLFCEGPPEAKASRLLFRSISSFIIRSASLIFFGCSMTAAFLPAKAFFFAAVNTFLGLL